jgi:phenylacetate-CoA ligase
MLATPELLQEAAQPQRLAEALSRGVMEIPLYRNRHNRAGNDYPAARSGAGALMDWPFITKADIRREFPTNFLGPGSDLDDLIEREVIELEHTSGTSEERTPLLLPRGWWAEQELRALSLNASVAKVLRQNPVARRVTISSPVCSGDIRYTGIPSRDERVIGNAQFVSLSRYPFLWSEKELDRIVGEVLEWQPEFLDVDPVYGVIFALHCERNRIRLPSLRFIVCSYEFVSVVHRAILARAFGVPVFDLYGSTETGHLLMEDDEGRMRPSLETAFLEVLDTDAHGVGELVVSTLSNPIMPLIRYRIGDLVKRADNPYGARYQLHGRTVDAFRISNGQRITTRQIDQCFVGLEGFAHYQLVQRAGEGWVLRFVPERNEPEERHLKQLVERLSPLLLPTTPISIQKTDMLVPEKSGKFRLGYPARDGAHGVFFNRRAQI